MHTTEVSRIPMGFMIRHLLQSGQENVQERPPYSWGDTRIRVGIFLLKQILELWPPKAP